MHNEGRTMLVGCPRKSCEYAKKTARTRFGGHGNPPWAWDDTGTSLLSAYSRNNSVPLIKVISELRARYYVDPIISRPVKTFSRW